MSAQDNTARAVIDRGALAQLLKARQEDVKEAISSANQEAQEVIKPLLFYHSLLIRAGGASSG